jgi:hypothetical protein
LASDADLHQAALDLLALPDDQTEQRLAYLAIFGDRVFPLEIDRLLEWARQLDDRPLYDEGSVPADRIPLWAFNVLCNVSHPKVRDLAFYLIETSSVAGQAVDLLANNYHEDDWRVIEDITRRDLDREEYHSLCLSVRAVFASHPEHDALPALLNLYERSPCVVCRSRMVEYIHWLGALPEWMLEECKHDSDLNLRKHALENFASIKTRGLPPRV